MNKQDILATLDSTNLKPDATRADIDKLCRDALRYRFASVCVNPCNVAFCAEILKDSGIAVASVIGFPLGANSPAVKAFEAAEAVEDGAQELDMVINIGALKDGRIDDVEADIRAVVMAGEGAIVKVIIETCLLNENEKVQACLAAVRAGAQFVKTSTGFSKGGATAEDVALMKRTVAGKCKVKAAGGIRTLKDCLAMLEAGADRIGTGSGAAIAAE